MRNRSSHEEKFAWRFLFFTFFLLLLILLSLALTTQSPEKREYLSVLVMPFFEEPAWAAEEPQDISPRIDSIMPSSAVPGDVIIISGANFGEYHADAFYNPAMDIEHSGKGKGKIDKYDVESLEAAFGAHQGEELYNPYADINPDGPDGKVDALDAKTFQDSRSFETNRGKNYVEFPEGIEAKIVKDEGGYFLWTDTFIMCRVPYHTSSGPIFVITEVGISDPIYFEVILE
ncbi:MAG: hypothetical protein JSW40_02700 [Candidatus Omnitrophota bacterium]|nr:MAG: hypothetical protein JSW40_02700 [Candidatus Omnitrophota bacterium]